MICRWFLNRPTKDGAITALTLAERLANGYGDDPFVQAWRKELFL